MADKDRERKPVGNTSTAVLDRAREDEIVMTPGGYRKLSDVHHIKENEALHIEGGRYKRYTLTGEFIEDLGPCLVKTIKKGSAPYQPPPSSHVVSAYWKNTTGSPITSFRAQWVVPPEPKNTSGQVIYLFTGLIDDAQQWILQPVLTYGIIPIVPGTGNFWSVISWFVDTSGKAFYSAAQRVNPGDTVTGVMHQTIATHTDTPPVVLGLGSVFEEYPGTTCLPVKLEQGLPELKIANIELEQYNVSQCLNYPYAAKTRVQNIEIKSGNAEQPVNWKVLNSDVQCGHEAEVVTNGSPNGVVDIWFLQPYQPNQPIAKYMLKAGDGIRVGEAMQSQNGRLRLAVQQDGNLVLYTPAGYPLWNSNTAGSSGIWDLLMQHDANLVLYDVSYNPLWSSNTVSTVHPVFKLQDDGNAVLYDDDSNKPYWATNTSVPSHPTTAPPPNAGTMNSGEGLLGGQSMTSPNGLITLKMQADGNLVLYAPGEQPIWASNTEGHTDVWDAVMQDDGNFVVYNVQNQPLWNTGTAGNSGAKLLVKDDGSLVIMSGGSQKWWNGTTLPAAPAAPVAQNRLNSGQGITCGRSLTSLNGRFTLTLQTDGNLVLYSTAEQPYWATNTCGKAVWDLIMQPDGNLVVYDLHNNPVWASNTAGNPNAYFVMQDDGNAVVYNSKDKPLWASDTVIETPVPTPPSQEWLLTAGQGILAGSSLTSSDDSYTLTLGGDGNLVLYGPPPCNQVLWSSNQFNDQVFDLIMQTDGNLVIYDRSNNPIWSTNTAGHPGAKFTVTSNTTHVLTLTDSSGNVIWSAV